MKRLIRLLLQGLLLVGPLAITVYILNEVFWFLDSILERFIGDVPGLGFVTLIGLLVFVGFLGTTFIADPIKLAFNKWLAKVPLVKLIYDALRDILSAFVGNKKKFTNPVMFKEHREATSYKIGFITQKNGENIQIKENVSVVYCPHSYALSGVVLLVENDYIVPLEASPTEVMKFLVTGGVVSK